MDRKLTVNLDKNSYDIIIEKGIISRLGEKVRSLYSGQKIFIITDENIFKYYGKAVEENLLKAGYEVDTLVLLAGEATKSFSALPDIYERMLSFKLNRKDLIITLGGGVIGDLGGFAASTFLRGIAYIQVPTSLLAQVDSSVGGKVAVNLPVGKNLVGSFYQPKGVFIDPEVLETLPDKDYTDGMAEVIKYGCIKDAGLFHKLSAYKNRQELMTYIEEIIYTCCNIKKSIVELDEKDYGERMLLNFGHTFGHAIEKYFNFEKYSHGQAVAIGMSTVTKISESIGITKKGTFEEIVGILKQYHLATQIDIDHLQPILDSIALDKKNTDSSLQIILLKELGQSMIYATTPSFFIS